MAKSLQGQINELKREVEKHHQQQRNLKKKVTALARRSRAIEPFIYAEERDAFVRLALDRKTDDYKTSF